MTGKNMASHAGSSGTATRADGLPETRVSGQGITGGRQHGRPALMTYSIEKITEGQYMGKYRVMKDGVQVAVFGSKAAAKRAVERAVLIDGAMKR